MATLRPFEIGIAPLLAAVDRGEPLESVLAALIRAVESRPLSGEATGRAGGDSDNNRMIGSILRLEGNRLRHGAAPNLPESYNAAIDGIEIGPNVGSCGTAAFCGHAIFVTDVGNDPLWKDFRDLVLHHGLRACWSQPILGSAGQVLGTFGVYYRDVRSPSAEERSTIAAADAAARLILERAAERAGLSQADRALESAAASA